MSPKSLLTGALHGCDVSLNYMLESPGKGLNPAGVWDLLQPRQSDSPAAAGIAEHSRVWHWQRWHSFEGETCFCHI